ncbi:unnamed protein product [Psylliodes chrysocephalus]|uniref:Grh/CP2 DB domain-containing protein n=1 Tax=Psylliodes chrysocephalus TaxID=3402493 RepID=A0A9P0D3C6_9CUCU|nr:unnamed protein product [Psylliodes chrysocephala]
MDYQLYENSDIMLNDNSDNSKNSWNLPGDCSMDNQNDLFGWTSIKIDEQDKNLKKRRLSVEAEESKNKQMAKGPIVNGKVVLKKNIIQRDAVKMQHWQVEDYTDLNTDIENSLNLNTNDLVGNTYTVSGNILGINNLTVFKQEAPSPTSSDVTTLQVAHKSRQSTSSTRHSNMAINSTMDDNQNMFNNTINQLLSQESLAGLHNVIENNSLASPNSQDSYSVSSTNYNLIEDSRFQYVLAAATSIATKQNEDTLTYLNQGQSYEIKLKKLGDLSFYRGKFLKSYVRICFHERRLQYMEKEQMTAWQNARPGDRILEADVPLSYGAFDITQPTNNVNVIHFNWDPTKEVGVYIKVNCISTEFTAKKHGGEKGVPFRIQVETYQNNNENMHPNLNKRLHAAACQIKVFKLKGADRKHKQDRDKIMKRPPSEQEKYQPSYECTVLNDLANDVSVSSSPPMSPLSSNNEANAESNSPIQNVLPTKDENVVDVIKNGVKDTPVEPSLEIRNKIQSTNIQLSQISTPEETKEWLSQNRFEKYLDTFESFSGDDMLRMTREDLMQICGSADGIRLYNAAHLKTIAPKLKMYVCQENTSVFNAVFLSSYNNKELLQKLSTLVGISQNQVRDIYLEGPHSIHIQLNNDLLKHFKEETMFTLQIISEENNSCILLLKRTVK